MKASRILKAIDDATKYLASIQRVVAPHVPVDVTDYSLEKFEEVGLVAWVPSNRKEEGYAHKWLVLLGDQLCPMHYHWSKSETITVEHGTIIVRLGGYSAAKGAGWDDRCKTVRVEVNGEWEQHDLHDLQIEAVMLTLNAGDAIFLPHGVWHDFIAVLGPALCVEVSTFNDDTGDNTFADPNILRFTPEIEQDVEGVKVEHDDLGFIIQTPA